MNKQYWHHIWARRIRPIKVWYLLVLLACSLFIFVSALRGNYERMIVLRNAVYAADQNNANVVGALQDLQRYVTSHMNTNLASGSASVYPPIQLKYTYERLQSEANQAAAQANTDVYTAAQKYCESQNSSDFSGRNRVPCIEQYVTSHGGAAPKTIPASLYKFNFISPTWSPDLAGWSLVISILLGLVTLLRLVLGWVMPKLVK